MLLPALNAARESARKASCMSNLKQIGLGIKQYANMMRWEGWYPYVASGKKSYDAFNLLCNTKKLTDTGMYICPSATTNNTKSTGTGKDPLAAGNTSYIYWNGLSESSAADSAVAADAPGTGDDNGNHTSAGNVLFVDGHVGQFDTVEGSTTIKWTDVSNIPNYGYNTKLLNE